MTHQTIEYSRGYEHSFFSGTPKQVERARKKLLKLGFEVRDVVDNKFEETVGTTRKIEDK
jgi:hypothetical protein